MQRSTRLLLFSCLFALPLLGTTPELAVGGFGAIDSYAPQIAADGSGFFVTWLEYDNASGQHRLYGTRVARDGRLVDGGGVLLSAEDPTAARVKYDGTHYVVAFVAERAGSADTFIRVLAIAPASGTVVREVIVPDVRGSDLALEVSATATFLAWIDDHGTLQLARIAHATGIAERVSLPIEAAYPALSWNGSSLLVAWNTMRVIVGSPTLIVPEAVHAARVDESLALLDPAPLLLENIAGTAAMEGSAPSIASDGREWFVAWGHDSRIHAATISAEGVPGSVLDLARGEMPLVIRNGDRYSLAWNEPFPETHVPRRLFVADVTPSDGQLAISSPSTAAVIPTFGRVSSVAGGANRHLAITWDSASAPEFDWQASFRIIDPATQRRRSVGRGR